MHKKGFQAQILTWIRAAGLSPARGPCKRRESSKVGGKELPRKEAGTGGKDLSPDPEMKPRSLPWTKAAAGPAWVPSRERRRGAQKGLQ